MTIDGLIATRPELLMGDDEIVTITPGTEPEESTTETTEVEDSGEPERETCSHGAPFYTNCFDCNTEEDQPAEQVVELPKIVPVEEVSNRNPRPTDICLTIETVDLYKRSDCRFYIKCLNQASIAGWQQFHCNDCPAYEPLPEETRQNKTLLRLALLLEKVKEREANKDQDVEDED